VVATKLIKIQKYVSINKKIYHLLISPFSWVHTYRRCTHRPVHGAEFTIAEKHIRYSR